MNFAHISAEKKASRSKKQAELQVKKDTWCKRIIYRKFFQLSAYKYRHTKKPELQNESEAQASTSSQVGRVRKRRTLPGAHLSVKCVSSSNVHPVHLNYEFVGTNSR